jgi:hypothetical protein
MAIPSGRRKWLWNDNLDVARRSALAALLSFCHFGDTFPLTFPKKALSFLYKSQIKIVGKGKNRQ